MQSQKSRQIKKLCACHFRTAKDKKILALKLRYYKGMFIAINPFFHSITLR